jgi:hypothetical protein
LKEMSKEIERRELNALLRMSEEIMLRRVEPM